MWSISNTWYLMEYISGNPIWCLIHKEIGIKLKVPFRNLFCLKVHVCTFFKYENPYRIFLMVWRQTLTSFRSIISWLLPKELPIPSSSNQATKGKEDRRGKSSFTANALYAQFVRRDFNVVFPKVQFCIVRSFQLFVSFPYFKLCRKVLTVCKSRVSHCANCNMTFAKML